MGDTGVVDGFGFGADHTDREVKNQFIVDHWTFSTGERCPKSIGLVGLVHDEAGEVVFPPFLVELDGIQELY